jgi:hypothetical protein
MTTSQALPRQSTELVNNIDQYEQFVSAWEPVLEWQNKLVRFEFFEQGSS